MSRGFHSAWWQGTAAERGAFPTALLAVPFFWFETDTRDTYQWDGVAWLSIDVGGSGAANQVAYWTGASVLAGDAGMTYVPATDTLTVINMVVSGLGAGAVQSSAAGVISSGPLPLTDLADYTQGDLIYGGPADWQDLAHPGAANRVLQSTVAEVGWSANAVTFPTAGAVPVGTGAANRVAYWSAVSTLTSDAGLLVDAANDMYIVADAGGIGNAVGTARLMFDSSGARDVAEFWGCYVGLGIVPIRPLHVANDVSIIARFEGDFNGVFQFQVVNTLAAAVTNFAGVELRGLSSTQERLMGAIRGNFTDIVDATRTSRFGISVNESGTLYDTFSVVGRKIGVNVIDPQVTFQLDGAGTANVQQILHTKNNTLGSTAELLFMADTNVVGTRGAKAGIIFERTTTWSRGSLHLVVDSAGDAGDVALADAKLTIDYLGNVGIGTTPSTRLDIGAGAMELDEMAAPGAGAVNTGRLYLVDNVGKTELYIIFAAGAAQLIAAQP